MTARDDAVERRSGGRHRRLIRSIAALLLLGSVVASCGGGGGDDADVTIVASGQVRGALVQLGRLYRFADKEFAVDVSVPEGDATDSLGEAGVYVGSAAAIKAAAKELATTQKPEPFGRDVLVVATPKGNPKGVKGIEAFGQPALRTGIADEKTSLGKRSRRALKAANISAPPDVVASGTSQLIAQVAAGDIDAALLPRRTALAPANAKKVDVVPIPAGKDAASTYQMLLVGDTEEARTFFTFLQSKEAKDELRKIGFVV